MEREGYRHGEGTVHGFDVVGSGSLYAITKGRRGLAIVITGRMIILSFTSQMPRYAGVRLSLCNNKSFTIVGHYLRREATNENKGLE